MAFTVNFYNVTDNPKKIDKTLGTAVATASCSPWEPVDDLNGSVLIDYSANAESANYATVSDGLGGRTLYCFVREFTKDIGGHCRVHLEIDPLTTNAGQLKQCDCICETTCVKEKHNRYITSNNMKVTQLTIYSMLNDEDIPDLEFDDDGVVLGIYSQGWDPTMWFDQGTPG